jgi:uncharacterized membrane protein
MIGKVRSRPRGIDDKTALDRLIFFSDAVFAVAITLLALDIRLPATAEIHTDADLRRALIELWPHYVAYILSFLTVGQFWLVHHRKFRLIRRYDGVLIRLNLLLLMVVAVVPFAASLLSEYGDATAVRVYAGVMMTVALLSAAASAWAAHGDRLVDPAAEQSIDRYRSLVVAGVFALSMAISLFSVSLAMWSWLLMLPAGRVTRWLTARIQASSPSPSSR